MQEVSIKLYDNIDMIEILKEMIDPEGLADPFEYYEDIQMMIQTLEHCKLVPYSDKGGAE